MMKAGIMNIYVVALVVLAVAAEWRAAGRPGGGGGAADTAFGEEGGGGDSMTGQGQIQTRGVDKCE